MYNFFTIARKGRTTHNNNKKMKQQRRLLLLVLMLCVVYGPHSPSYKIAHKSGQQHKNERTKVYHPIAV